MNGRQIVHVSMPSVVATSQEFRYAVEGGREGGDEGAATDRRGVAYAVIASLAPLGSARLCIFSFVWLSRSTAALRLATVCTLRAFLRLTCLQHCLPGELHSGNSKGICTLTRRTLDAKQCIALHGSVMLSTVRLYSSEY